MKTAYAYKVDKNIPLSARPAGPGRPRIYPWEHMSVGDSFFVPNRTSRNFAVSQTIKASGMRFAVRTRDNGVRVWRIE